MGANDTLDWVRREIEWLETPLAWTLLQQNALQGGLESPTRPGRMMPFLRLDVLFLFLGEDVPRVQDAIPSLGCRAWKGHSNPAGIGWRASPMSWVGLSSKQTTGRFGSSCSA